MTKPKSRLRMFFELWFEQKFQQLNRSVITRADHDKVISQWRSVGLLVHEAEQRRILADQKLGHAEQKLRDANHANHELSSKNADLLKDIERLEKSLREFIMTPGDAPTPSTPTT